MSEFYPSFRLVYNYSIVGGMKFISDLDEEVILQIVKRLDYIMKSIGVDFKTVNIHDLEKRISIDLTPSILSIGGPGHAIHKDYIHIGKDFPLDYYFIDDTFYYVLKDNIASIDITLSNVTFIYIYDTLQLNKVDTIQNGDILKMEWIQKTLTLSI